MRRTVESILGQQHRQDWEWIVIDGGSTDGSVDYLTGLKDHISVLVSERDGGIYDAMNKGLRRATGEYVWFVNAGDALHDPLVIGQVVGEIRAYEGEHGGQKPDVVFGDTMFIDDAGTALGLISQLKPQPFPKRLHAGSFRFGMNVCHQSVLVRRSLAPEYDVSYRQAADVDWMIAVLKSMRGGSLRLSFVVSDFETGGSSYQHTQKAWKERYAVLSKHYGGLWNFFAHAWILFRRLLFNLKLLGKRSSAA